MKKWMIGLSLIFVCVTAGAQGAREEAADLFARGKAAYSDAKYAEAIDAFQKTIDTGYPSGNVYFNLGNAFFRFGETGKAILNYERARLLIPRDQDLRFNLRFAKARVSSASYKENMFDVLAGKFAGYWSEAELVWACVFVLLMLAVLHVWGLFFNWPRKATGLWLCVGAIGFLIFASGLLIKRSCRNDAIIITNAKVYFEPRDNATVYFSVGEGERVTFARREKDWVKIERKDGKMGWLKAGVLEKIINSKEHTDRGDL